MTIPTVLSASFAAEIASLGMEDRTANEVLGRAVPPKLAVAVMMADAAARQEINVTHLDAIMGAYYGNQLPASIVQQKSKFKVFLDAGVKLLPVGAVVRRVAEMIDTKRAIVAEMQPGKDRDREQKAADRFAAGVFEKGTSLARLQGKKGAVMLDDAEIMSIMSPEAKVSDDPLGDGLEALIKAAEKLQENTPFTGFDGVAAALNAALSTHHARINAGCPVTPQSNTAVPENVTMAPVATQIVAVPNNVVVLPAAKTVILPADVELDELLAVG